MSLLKHIQLTAPKNLLTDVENRSVYNLNHCELNVFETYRPAEKVQLTFHDMVITSMVRGKKVMHLPNTEQFDYFPGETVLAPAGTRMFIDFPEAMAMSPTQCIALTLDNDCLTNTINYLNEYHPRSNHGEKWNFNFKTGHLKNSNSLAEVINKMVTICTETTTTKDILADLTMKELVVRLVQQQYLNQLDGIAQVGSYSGPFQQMANYIREHLHDKLDITLLSRKACMSRTQLFRTFKREFGITPVQFITKERLKIAKELLCSSKYTVQQVSMETGFDDVNNFIKVFKKTEGTTPGGYRVKILSQVPEPSKQ
ncbi:MAG: AraC family transcriptional regulator N-terminal domain-containing protein [Flavipsychrobacter sp.]|nr:AraC family transcriptional regulator N-terminal domain-containing protein [Flavipsychrobacter sp.]